MFFNVVYRTWEKHNAPDTTTDDTDEDRSTGGYGKYSHGHKCLSHQHWVDQLVQAGTFHLNCTEGAEAFHKTCLGLPSSRVRHLGESATKTNMMNYLFSHHVFEGIQERFYTPQVPKKRHVNVQHRVAVPLRHWICGAVNQTHQVHMGKDLSSELAQSQFLHEEVRIARVEILDLVCDQVNLPTTRRSYDLLAKLEWGFGQKLVTAKGETFWATDTQYTAFGHGDRRTRRDVLHVRGTEQVPVRLPNRTIVHKSTAMCFETVCFITISGWSTIYLGDFFLPLELDLILKSESSPNDTLTFVLGRWLSPHPDAWDRDSMHRPVCTGPLKINHCLWTYAKTCCPRQMLADKYFNTQKHIFGKTEYQQIQTRNRENKAYYCLVLPSYIYEKIHATREYGVDGTLSDTWIQSVHIIS